MYKGISGPGFTGDRNPSVVLLTGIDTDVDVCAARQYDSIKRDTDLLVVNLGLLVGISVVDEPDLHVLCLVGNSHSSGMERSIGCSTSKEDKLVFIKETV